MPLTKPEDIKHLLEATKTVAVVGYSDKPDRPSNEITLALIKAGYDVYPVNPILESTDELRIYPSLADIPVRLDVVDIFRKSDAVPEVVEEAIAVGAKAVWMQLGIINDEAARRAEEAGLQVVMDHCIKVENRRLLHKP